MGVESLCGAGTGGGFGLDFDADGCEHDGGQGLGFDEVYYELICSRRARKTEYWFFLVQELDSPY